MTIHSRVDLVNYAMRKLGAPVINIEVDAAQVEDRVDEALQFFQDFHYDGTERIYLKHQIVGTVISVSTTAGFVVGEIVKGASASFQIVSIKSATQFVTRGVYSPTGIIGSTFALNETLTGQTSGSMAAFVFKLAGEIESGSIPISDMVTGVIRAIPLSAGTNGAMFMFDPKYQVIMSTFQNLSSSSMIYYEQLMSHISLLDQVLRPIDSVRFNRKMGQVSLDIDWTAVEIGQFIIFECYRILDPEVYLTIYNDRMLKRLVTAKIKYQWGQNVSKYAGIQLLGGVTIDGSRIMSEAVAEIEASETEIRENYQEPSIGFLA